MIVVFGKGKVGNGIKHLLQVVQKPCIVMDDEDLDDTILAQAEVILMSPGVKQSHRLYQVYRDKIQSELNFLGKEILPLLQDYQFTWVGITATNGKSTTTWVAYNVLAGMFPEKKVWIAGNFDIPVSEILAQIIETKQTNKEHIMVVECSSFMLYQLQDFSFDYSILLNIARDHLDWHKDWDEYRDSKLNLLKFTKKCGICPLELMEHLSHETRNHTKKLPLEYDLSETQFLGKHNQSNLAAVRLLTENYVVDSHLDLAMYQEKFTEVVKTVSPLDHRLKLLTEKGGVKIYDDGICTSSHSLSAALDSFDNKVVLLAGGYDKGDDYTWLQDLCSQKVAFMVLIGQTKTKFEDLCIRAGVAYICVDSFHEAVQGSYEKAKELGNVLLFSPGAASFDMFKNVYHRVEQFVMEVEML